MVQGNCRQAWADSRASDSCPFDRLDGVRRADAAAGGRTLERFGGTVARAVELDEARVVALAMHLPVTERLIRRARAEMAGTLAAHAVLRARARGRELEVERRHAVQQRVTIAEVRRGRRANAHARAADAHLAARAAAAIEALAHAALQRRARGLTLILGVAKLLPGAAAAVDTGHDTALTAGTSRGRATGGDARETDAPSALPRRALHTVAAAFTRRRSLAALGAHAHLQRPEAAAPVQTVAA
jgi:hypothetical protein